MVFHNCIEVFPILNLLHMQTRKDENMELGRAISQCKLDARVGFIYNLGLHSLV